MAELVDAELAAAEAKLAALNEQIVALESGALPSSVAARPAPVVVPVCTPFTACVWLTWRGGLRCCRHCRKRGYHW